MFGDSTLAHVDSEGRVLDQTLAGQQPAGVLVADGSVWVTNSGDATVQRYNPATFRQGPLRTFPVGRQPVGIASAEGAIWVAISGEDFIMRIEPDSGATDQIEVGTGPSAVASSEGAVWVANVGTMTVSRIDPATREVVETIEIGNVPSGLAVQGDFLWVTAQAAP